MKTKINWKKIRSESPGGFGLFCDYLKLSKDFMLSESVRVIEDESDLNYIDFFDANGIEITLEKENRAFTLTIRIKNNIGNTFFSRNFAGTTWCIKRYIDSYPKAEKRAIKTGFEILERKLNQNW